MNKFVHLNTVYQVNLGADPVLTRDHVVSTRPAEKTDDKLPHSTHNDETNVYRVLGKVLSL